MANKKIRNKAQRAISLVHHVKRKNPEIEGTFEVITKHIYDLRDAALFEMARAAEAAESRAAQSQDYARRMAEDAEMWKRRYQSIKNGEELWK